MGRKVKGVMRGSRGNLVSPARLRPLVGVDIRFVASGCGELLPPRAGVSDGGGVTPCFISSFKYPRPSLCVQMLEYPSWNICNLPGHFANGFLYCAQRLATVLRWALTAVASHGVEMRY
jgi:hypothetical protein